MMTTSSERPEKFGIMLMSVLLFVSVSGLDFLATTSRERYYKELGDFEDQVPISPPLRKLDGVSISQCALDCLERTSLCFVFSHNYYSKECKQYDFDDFANTSLKIENGSTIFQKGCSTKGFTLLRDICFKISTEDEVNNYEEAVLECGKYNAVLISLDTTDKFLHVLDFLTPIEIDGTFLVGLTDIESEGTWLWQNSNPADVSLFFQGEPNDYDSTGWVFGADCAMVYVRYRRYSDYNCQRPVRFICEVI